MVLVIGDNPHDITSSEASAVSDVIIPDRIAGALSAGAIASSGGGGGNVTPQQASVVNHVEQKLDAVVSGWVDSGGPGGHQQAVAHEILRRASLLQGHLLQSVRQWAKPGRERAMLEMFGVVTQAMVDRDRLLLELRDRMNDSPY